MIDNKQDAVEFLKREIKSVGEEMKQHIDMIQSEEITPVQKSKAIQHLHTLLCKFDTDIEYLSNLTTKIDRIKKS